MHNDIHGLQNAGLCQRYEAAGFRGRVGFGERPALLVIDMAEAWMDPSTDLGSDLNGVLDGIVSLLEAARTTDVPVFFTTMAFGTSSHEIGEVVARKTPHLRGNIRGSDRVRIDSALERRRDEPLIEKPRASALFQTNLLSMLLSASVDTVIVTGCSTSGCIRSTCEEAFNHNLRVIVPEEAVGDRSNSAHVANLFDIDARYGDVVSLHDTLAHLSARMASA